jgi:HSP20 family protein
LGALTVWQDAQHLEVEVDVPGFAQTDLELRLEEGKLWIRGERKPPREGFAYNDRPAGKFERAVLLPETIDPGSIDATLAEGVLQVRLSKKPEAQPQPIPIKVRPEVAQPLPPAVS